MTEELFNKAKAPEKEQQSILRQLQVLQWQRARAIEDLLRNEYEAAMAELDKAKETRLKPECLRVLIEDSIDRMRRLRQFLTDRSC